MRRSINGLTGQIIQQVERAPGLQQVVLIGYKLLKGEQFIDRDAESPGIRRINFKEGLRWPRPASRQVTWFTTHWTISLNMAPRRGKYLGSSCRVRVDGMV